MKLLKLIATEKYFFISSPNYEFLDMWSGGVVDRGEGYRYGGTWFGS